MNWTKKGLAGQGGSVRNCCPQSSCCCCLRGYMKKVDLAHC